MSMRRTRTRTRRRPILEMQRITIGDYVVILSSVVLLISLFLPWLQNGPTSQWAFTYSEVAAVVVIVFFLAVLFLVIYPVLSPDLNLPVLPVSTAMMFLVMGALLLLLFTYELGKYSCVLCVGLNQGSRGLGVWLGWIASLAFLAGAVLKWGSRLTRHADRSRL